MTDRGFALGDAAVAGWPDLAGLEVVGRSEWKMFRCPVQEVTATELVVAEPCWTQSKRQPTVSFDTVAWLENSRALCDEPGEFFVDEVAGEVLYRPRPEEDLGVAEVVLPRLEQLVRGVAAVDAPLHDVAFEGLEFAHTTWLAPDEPHGYAPIQATIHRTTATTNGRPLAAVSFDGVRRVRIADARFDALGGAGLSLDRSQGSVVEATWFEDVAAAAVMIGDVRTLEDHHPATDAQVVADNTVRTSYITRAGWDYQDAVGIFVGYTTRTTLEHNELFDLPYTGISVGWGWGGVDAGEGTFDTPTQARENVVRGNVISHHMRALHDGGAIYTLGAQPGSVIEGNVISNQGSRYGNLYLDNGTQGYTVRDNVVRLAPKADLGGADDPYRSYWLYVQVYPRVARNNVVGVNYTDDPTPLEPQPMDPSNSVVSPVLIGDAPAEVAAIVAAAGSPLRPPNLAEGGAATASSVWNASFLAGRAVDGNAHAGWSAAAPSADPQPSWQLDLGATTLVSAIELVPRFSLDQPATRRDLEVRLADDEAFTTSTVVGTIKEAATAHRAITVFEVSPPRPARYVQVAKTVPGYLYLGEVRVRGTRP
jgi:hypothetical protein